jgi:hypothetical protein
MSTNGAREEIEKQRLAAVEHLASLVDDPQVADRRRDQAATTLLSLSLGTGARREPSTASKDNGLALRDGGGRALTDRHLPALIKAIASHVRDTITEMQAPLIARIAELEQKPGLKYQGVWAAEKVYSVGDFVTDHGSLWHCWDTNVGVRPGSSDTWQLAVQRGKDGRDVRGNR